MNTINRKCNVICSDSISDDDAGSQSKKSCGSFSSSSTSTNTTPSTPDTPPTMWAKSPKLSTPRGRQAVNSRSNMPMNVVTFNGRSIGEVDSIGDADDAQLDSKAPLRRLSRGVHVNQETKPSHFMDEDDDNSETSMARSHAVMARSYYQKSNRGHVSESSSDLDGDVFVKDGGYTSSRDSRDVLDDASIELDIEIDSTLVRGTHACVAGAIAAKSSCASFGQLTSSDYCSESELSVGTISIADNAATPAADNSNSVYSNWSLLEMLVAVQGYGNGRRTEWRFSPIPRLPHPRLEMTWDSPFDGIRVFLAQTRDPTEVFAVQRRRSDKRGFAIAQLRELLQSLDGKEDEVLYSTRL